MTSASSWAAALAPQPGPTLRKSTSVNGTIRPWNFEAFSARTSSTRRLPEAPLALTSTRRLLASMPATTLAICSSDIGRRLVAVDVDHRELRLGDGMLDRLERRPRLVLGDGRLRELRRTAVAGSPLQPGGPALSRRGRRLLGQRPVRRRSRTAAASQNRRCAHAWGSSNDETIEREITPQRACKPNSVRRRPALRPNDGEMTIPLGASSLTRSSDLPGSGDRTGRPNGRSHALPYLVLLHAGFGLPRLLPAARCALTAPFHPYLERTKAVLFSVPLSVGLPRPGVTRRTALWSSDFPPRGVLRASAAAPRGGHPARCGVVLPVGLL